MRVAFLCAFILLAPFARADHSIGHVVVPGGEVVDLAGDAVDEALPPALREIVGDLEVAAPAECSWHLNASGPYLLGLPVPRDVEDAHAECRAGETVIVTPDPFYG